MLGRLEIVIMEILWETGDANVHEVSRLLDRPLAYTTVMTTLDRLYKKGLLDRRKSDRAFRYAPKLSRAAWERKRAGDWFSNFLSGSIPAQEDLLISSLVDAVSDQSVELLDELEKKIRQKREHLEGGSS